MYPRRVSIPALPMVDPRALNALEHGRAGQFAVQVLDQVWGDPGAGAQIEQAFRRARWMGSKTRRMVRDLVYACIRQQDLLGSGAPRARWQALVRRLRGEVPTLPTGTWERLAACGSVPIWLLREVGDQDAAERFVHGLSGRAGVTLRVPVEQRDALAERLGGQATRWSARGVRFERLDVAGLPEYRAGQAEVQDEGSQLVAELVDAQAGMTVLDWCAGGGGKALAVLAATPGARVLAADVRDGALEQARQRAARARVPLEVVAHNALPMAERVLVDAPCSGTGTLRRDPALRWRLTRSWVDERVALQAAILDEAAARVAVGGRLIYATCSALRRENDGAIDAFLARDPRFEAVSTARIWGEERARQLGGDRLRLETAVHGTDAFFGAVVQRLR